MPKITLDGDKLYVIRSTRIKPDGSKHVSYFMSRKMWTRSPVSATIFCDYDAACHLQYDVHQDAPKKGWADGSTEVFDVVPLIGEIMLSPNGVTIDPSNPSDPTKKKDP